MRDNRNRTLTRDLTTSLIGISVLTALVITALNAWLFWGRLQERYDRQASEYFAYLQSSLAIPLWTFDEQTLVQIGEASLKNEVIAAIAIRDSTNTIIFQRQKQQTSADSVRSGDIVYQGKNIGSFTLGFTSAFYRGNFVDWLQSAVSTSLLIIFIISISSVLLLKLSVLNPISHLMVRIQQITDSDYDMPPHQFRQREIEEILYRFGIMAEKVREREQSLLATNQRLQQEIDRRKSALETLKEREQLLKLYLEYTPAATAMCDRQMRYLAYSRRWIADYQLPRQDLIGACHYDVFQTIPEKWKQQHQRCFQGEVIVNEEEPFARPDGSVDWVRRSLHPWKTRNGEVGGLIMFTEVTTKKKKTEIDLLESEDRFSAIGDNLPGGMIYQVKAESDDSRRFTYVSGGVQALFGYSPAQVIANPSLLYQQIVPEDLEQVQKAEALAISRMQTFDVVVRMRSQLGDIRWHRLVSQPRTLQNGGVVFDGIDLDITDLKQAEAALQQKADMLRRIIDIVPSGIFAKNSEGRFLMANKAVAGRYGLAAEELTGRLHRDLHGDTDEIDAMLAADRQAIESGQAVYIPEQPFTDSSGVTRWLETIKVPCPVSDFGEPAIVGLSTEITERIAANQELKRLRNYLANIINSMPSILVGVDAEGRVTQWNRQAEQQTGVVSENAEGQLLEQVMPQLKSGMAMIRNAIRNRDVQRQSKINRSGDGDTRYEDVTIFPLTANGVEGAVIRIDDVTEQVRMEEMIIQSEKMLSVGGLAAGMAHEINNPLAGMMQTASVMSDRLIKDIPANLRAARDAGTTIQAINAYVEARSIDRMLSTIQSSGRRAADIIENMLSFARKVDTGVSSHDLTELLDMTIELAATDYDLKKHYDFKRIRIIKEYEPDLPPVPCEKQKIQQVFLNILKNGAESMQLRSRQGQPQFILRAASEAGGVRIEIEDNGPGMDEKTRKRVFEPFFSTKSQGLGTGLGLSISYFIITENHGGTMTVESGQGQGARFIITLPMGTAESISRKPGAPTAY